MGKRKSCDLCTLKKIKCDGLSPSCSRCLALDAKCSWTPGIHRRVRGPPQPRKPLVALSRPQALVQLEQRLAEVEGEVLRLRAAAAAATATFSAPTPACTLSDGSPAEPVGLPMSNLLWASSRGDLVGSLDNMILDMPPREEIQPMVDSYFRNFNTYLPLFEHASIVQMLRDWYCDHSAYRSEVAWATINVIVALGLQRLPKQLGHSSEEMERSYIANVQSVLQRLVMRTEDLGGLQVLLGLSFYIQQSSDPTPAQFLSAAAVKLAYRTGLHVAKNDYTKSPQIAAERNRLFWLVFILDRDMSMASGDPYMLREHDRCMSLPCVIDTPSRGPASHPEDTSYFSQRVGLAHIQGEVYDKLFSVYVRDLTSEQMTANAEVVWDMVHAWSAALSKCFRPENQPLHAKVPADEVFVLLYFTYFRIICKALRIHSHNTQWMRCLIDYSSRWSLEFDPAAEPAASPLPSHWDEIVDAARTCMALFHQSHATAVCQTEEVRCTYVAALVILVGHRLTVMEHQQYYQLASDHELIAQGIARLRLLPDDSSITRKYELYRTIASACQELKGRADSAEAAFGYLVLQHSGDALGAWDSLAHESQGGVALSLGWEEYLA
ncbi:fungal-specific transcription factor domain-domain-containing protein [Microdochium bolleyi]|uniref:Fungal-specific transcription factor domain-domain-containing protein n=1 Tax=Microdochium bolleyi TaxID=196109 RepID=A0A136JCN9_9PEZI|nr:fungal-specific transcription factor domain-domain-containing protein [Microdochium bolleyi]